MWKKVILTIIVLIVGLVALVNYATSGMTEVANEFFIHVKTKHYNDAYAMLSDDFKKTTTQKVFEDFLVNSRLTDFKSVDWNEKSFESSSGKLDGSVTTQKGGVIPITLNFVKYGEEWKIYSIFQESARLQKAKDPAGLISSDKKVTTTEIVPASDGMPSQEVIKHLTKESTLLFANAVNDKNMSSFYANVSNMWRQSTTVEELNNAFAIAFSWGIDFTILQNVEPIFDKKSIIDKNGQLFVSGYYPTSPNIFTFEHGYIKEGGQWKLSQFYVNLKAPQENR